MTIKNLFKLAVIICIVLSCGQNTEEQTLKQMGAEVIPVKAIAINSSESNYIINATGLITTENEAQYAFKIGGVVENIWVEEGDTFKKGQLLATLKLTEIESQFLQAQMSFEKSKRDFNRTNNLYRDSVATLEQFQNAKTNLDIALQSLEAVEFNKQYARIYANTDGFVSSKLANEGEIIGAGNPVLKINELNAKQNWIVRLGVTDKEWSLISKGQQVKLSVDAFPNTSLKGIVSKKSMAANQSNGSYLIEVKILEHSNQLAVGMFAKAQINIDANTGFITIPYEALIEANGKEAMVFVPVNNRVKRIPILVESFNNDHVIVKSGLEQYDTIITSNSAFLNDNSTIKIIN